MTEDQIALTKAIFKEVVPFAGTDVKIRFLDSVPGDTGYSATVGIRPDRYPEAMIQFFGNISESELRLRDSGLNVRLVPDIKQRFIVVASVPSLGEFAIQSEDGREFDDLAETLGKKLEDLSGTVFDGYPFDSDDEKSVALADAQKEHPKADFSKVA